MKVKELGPFIVFLTVFLDVIPGGSGASGDFTSIWYNGCRWLGGSTIGLICNCTEQAEEIYIQQTTITGMDISIIELNNCPKLRFAPQSIQLLRNLRSITLRNSRSITLEENSLNWIGYRTISNNDEPFDLTVPSLRVLIANSHIENIASMSFSGRINEIKIEYCHIDNIEAFAFSNLLQTENIQLKYTNIKNINPQAFKKFATQSLTLLNVSADTLPSRTFTDITISKNLFIDHCDFHTLRPAAFYVNKPSLFLMSNTRINQVEGEAFWIIDCGDVMIRSNTFQEVNNEAFNGIKSASFPSRMITFDSNVISNINRRSLQVQPSLETRVMNLKFNQSCDCDSIGNTLIHMEFFSEIQCVSEDGEFVSAQNYKSRSCSVLTGYYTVLIIVCVLILVVAVIVVVFYVYYRLVYRSQKYGCEKDRKAPLSLIVPDGKTYKETEIHVVVERADLLTTDL